MIQGDTHSFTQGKIWGRLEGVERDIQETDRMFSKVAAPFYIPTSSVWKFWFLPHSYQHLLLSFYSNHHSGYEVVSHCGLDLHFSDDCFFHALNNVWKVRSSWFRLSPIYQFFSFTDHVFGVESKKSSPNPWSQRFYTMLFLEMLVTVWGFRFSSMIHLESACFNVVQSMDQSLVFCMWISDHSSTTG